MHYHDWSLTDGGAPDGHLDDPSAPSGDPTDLPEANVPQLVDGAPLYGHGEGLPGHEAIAPGDHGIDPGPHRPLGPGGADQSSDHVTTRSDHFDTPPAWQLHIDHFSVVSAGEIDVKASNRDEGSHHDLLSLFADAGWLDPKSAPMVFAGTVFAGTAGHRLKRLVGASTQDLAGRVRQSEHLVVAVDADELDRTCGRSDRLSDVLGIPGQGAQRPVEVVSMQTTDDEGATVVLNDWDGPLGRRTVPLSVFEAAWKKSGQLAFTNAGASSGEATRLDGPRGMSGRER